MMLRLLLLLAALAFPGAIFAQTLTFETDEGVVIIRTYDQFGMTITEFIGEPGRMYQCIALDDADQPIASSTAMADVGQIIFSSLEASRVSRVSCRGI